MLRVNGLYGHIQRNNLKSALLIAAFLGLFAVLQIAIQFAPYLMMSQLGTDIDKVFVAGPTAQLRATHEEPIKIFRRRAGLPEVDPDDTPSLSLGSTLDVYLSVSRFLRANMLLVTIVLASIYLAGATWWNSLYIRYAMRARPLSRSEQPALYNLVENLAITAGLPCPAIEVIESDGLNAYASGLTPRTARIGVTTGLVRSLDRDELEAVIAHELTHIRYRDSRLMAITKACADLVVSGLLKFGRQVREQPVRTLLPFAILPFAGPVIFLTVLAVWCVAGLVVLATYLVKGMILHSREFVADAGAIELTKNPAALISALRKIAGVDDVGVTNPAAQAMMFSGSTVGLLSTHPSIESRIEAIRLHAGSTALDETAHRARRQPTIAPSEPAGRGFATTKHGAAGRAGFAGADRPSGVQAFGRRRVQGSSRAGTPANGQRVVDVAHFETQAIAREIWRDDGVFSARRPIEDGSPGNSLFERYVMSGWLDQTKNGVERAGKQIVSTVRRVMFAVWLSMMAWGLFMTVMMR